MIWKIRGNEAAVFLINAVYLTLLLPIALFYLLLPVTDLFTAIALSLFWLFLVSWVQKRQLRITFRAAFFGALMQWVCFGFALCGCLILDWNLRFFFIAEHLLIWFVSAALTYALLALFRPTIYGAWDTWRQKLREK